MGEYPYGEGDPATLMIGETVKEDAVTVHEGMLKITPVDEKVTVTITEHKGEFVYDSTEKTVSGYDVSIDNELYFVKDFTFSGTDSVSGTDAGTYEMKLKPEDFKTIWYVCPYGTQGGFVAIKLLNALSTGGLSLQSGDKAKGQWSFSYTGYTSIDNPDEVPMRFYLKSSAEAAAVNVEPAVE